MEVRSSCHCRDTCKKLLDEAGLNVEPFSPFVLLQTTVHMQQLDCNIGCMIPFETAPSEHLSMTCIPKETKQAAIFWIGQTNDINQDAFCQFMQKVLAVSELEMLMHMVC